MELDPADDVRRRADVAGPGDPRGTAAAPSASSLRASRSSTSGRWSSGIGESLATAKFNTLLLTLLGAIGVVLAAVGIYGVIAYFVTRRTQEIGVRMALGATRRDVVALVVTQAAWPVAAGIVLGVVVSAGVTRVLSTQLFGVSRTIRRRSPSWRLALPAWRSSRASSPRGGRRRWIPRGLYTRTSGRPSDVAPRTKGLRYACDSAT